MSSKPWYAWYPADYKSKTAHLSFLQDAAYRRMIDAYYERGGPLPNDRPALFRICGAMDREEQEAVDFIVSSFFYLNDKELHSRRCDDELARSAQFHARLSDAGKRGGMLGGRGRNRPGQIETKANPQPQSHITATVTPTITKNKNTRKPVQTSLPVEFGQHFSPSMLTWLEKRKEPQLKAHLIWFIGHAEAKGWVYANWERALQNAIREDWAGIRKALP